MSYFPANPGGNNQFKNISYSDWLNLTDAQKETGKWYVTDIPGADGTLSIDLMTKLWENPDSTSNFATQNITLSSDDYDLLLIIYIVSKGSSRKCSELTFKGSGATLSIAEYSSNAASNRTRYFTYLSATVYTVSGGYLNGVSNDTIIIPYQVYGIKLHQTVEIKAIAPEVSTLASKCMMSDGETSVEDAVDAVKASLENYVDIQANCGFHNSIYRGKNLGTSVTAVQWVSISAGTFEDMYVGDYWVINGVTWRIAHFDYWLNTGDTNCTTHHVVIVPDTNLYSAQMNTENITTGGYHGSVMYTTNLANAKTTINNAFGSSHILSHRELLTNAVLNGNASGWAWYDSTVELMSEIMVYGGLAWSVGGKGYEVGIDKEQLALFRLDHSRICNRAHWWLRSVFSATAFAFVNYTGSANSYYASYSLGVRPAFAIK